MVFVTVQENKFFFPIYVGTIYACSSFLCIHYSLLTLPKFHVINDKLNIHIDVESIQINLSK